MALTNPARENKAGKQSATGEGNPRYERNGKHGRERCSISEVGLELLADCIHSVARAGDLLSFGKTSDGGAWVLSVYSNGKRYPEYASSSEELEEVLRRITEAAGS